MYIPQQECELDNVRHAEKKTALYSMDRLGQGASLLVGLMLLTMTSDNAR